MSISSRQIYDNVVNEGLGSVHNALGHLPQYCDSNASYPSSVDRARLAVGKGVDDG